MGVLYNTAISAYAAAARLAAARSEKVSRMLAGQRESVGRILAARARKALQGFDFWFHVASLGEFEQARPLIEQLKKERPQATILLTFFSPSGYEVRKDYPLVDCVAYLPFDKPANVRRFLDAAAPRRAVFVKYEFWINYITGLRERDIPVYLIDAIFRPGQRFFRPGGAAWRRLLGCYKHIFVQDKASKALLQSIGITDVTVAGDTRFDRVANVRSSAVSLPQIEAWLSHNPFTLVVGSSWDPDEDRYIPWLNAHPEVRAIIAPHEFDDARLAAIRARLAAPSLLYSEVKATVAAIPADTQTLIIDSFGLLSSLYRFGSVAIIGGGFGAGIHNINEAAVYGIPVLFGPRHQKFKEATDLIACGAATEYTDAATLTAALDTYLADPAARAAAGHAAAAYITASLGATARILPSLL